MNIRSLGWRTDLIFPRFDGIVEDRGDCLVVRTPTNPGYYWGNFLLFRDPPAVDSLPAWKERFRLEISSIQPADHVTFGWDSPEGEAAALEPFLAEGFRLEENVVLSAETLSPPPHVNGEIGVRPLASAEDWAQVLRNQVECRPAEFALEDYRVFKERQMARYRRMAEAGAGAWYGAFLDDRVVADLGIFVDGGLARFQRVETHPDFRRRGICGTLVYEAARQARSSLGAERMVIVADENYHAGRIYAALGFRRTERQLGLELRPRE
jgi:ribosomal protein S18 acetylase RimI-like enzyme